MLAVALPTLLLFLGLAIDAGFAYVTKARLSKAVDAACLTTMKNLSQGQTVAKALGTTLLNATYPTTGLDSIPPAADIIFRVLCRNLNSPAFLLAPAIRGPG